ARCTFQVLQFLKQSVIDCIADAWAVEIVILIPVAVEPVVQLPLLHQQILVHQAASFSKTRNAIISVSAVCSLRVYDLHTPSSNSQVRAAPHQRMAPRPSFAALSFGSGGLSVLV